MHSIEPYTLMIMETHLAQTCIFSVITNSLLQFFINIPLLIVSNYVHYNSYCMWESSCVTVGSCAGMEVRGKLQGYSTCFYFEMVCLIFTPANVENAGLQVLIDSPVSTFSFIRGHRNYIYVTTSRFLWVQRILALAFLYFYQMNHLITVIYS